MKKGFSFLYGMLNSKLINYFCLFVIGICFHQILFGQASSDLNIRLEKLPYAFSSVAEYDKANGLFYGRMKKGKVDYLATISENTGEVSYLCKLPKFQGWYRSTSALDIESNRFFFMAFKNNILNLCIVNMSFGNKCQLFPIETSIENIAYCPENKKIFGVSKSGIINFVSIDLNTGVVSNIKELKNIVYTGVGARIEGSKYYLVGKSKKGIFKLYEIQLNTGAMKNLFAKSVRINEYQVVNFKNNRNKPVLFTNGVQACTAIAGYDENSNVGFIGHFSPKYHDLDNALSDIQSKITSISKSSGISKMKIVVVGGVRSKKSIENLHSVYKLLVDTYGVKYEDIGKFNTGVSMSLMIHEKAIKFF